MNLEDIKYASRILNSLDHPRMFEDLKRNTSIEGKVLQTALRRLQKLGYVDKNDSGLWIRIDD